MLRPGTLAPWIAPLGVVLLLSLTWCRCPAAEAASPNSWQAAGDNPFRDKAAPQWMASRDSDRDLPTLSRPAPAWSAVGDRNTKPSRPAAASPAANPRRGRIVERQPAPVNEPARQQTADSGQWMLPNQTQSKQSPRTESAKPRAESVANSPSTEPQEPRAFTPPRGAAQLAPSAPPTARSQPVQPASATRPADARPTHRVSTQGTVHAHSQGARPRPTSPQTQPTRPARVAQKPAPNNAPSWLRTINVAFQGSDEWEADGPEELLPAPKNHRGSNPSQSYGPGLGREEAYYMPHDESIYDTMDMMGCGDCCGSACGDDLCCEPSCACEPACGCGGHDDLFCIGCGDDEACHTIRVTVPKVQDFVVFGGVHGFKGPYDQERDGGNFGFHEGFNMGLKMPHTPMGYQLGYQSVHSQLHGDKNTGDSDSHTQHFFTAGVFHRTMDGIQFGIAWDSLRDDRFGAFEFHQVRGELSYVECGCHELGVAATFGLNDRRRETFEIIDDVTFVSNSQWGATDQYLLFYRYHSKRGGEGRIFGGLTDDGDGIIGADALIPLQDRWSLQPSFTYLIPNEDDGFDGASQEAWNISINLVWHWKFAARTSHSNPYRPLFNVADNGSMIID